MAKSTNLTDCLSTFNDNNAYIGDTVTLNNIVTTTTSTTMLANIGSTAIGTTTTAGFVLNGSGYNPVYDKSILFGKDGDILMDLKAMKFKVFCSEKGWEEYDLEDFSTKNKKAELNGSKDSSVYEMKISRQKRGVLTEKRPKPVEIGIKYSTWITEGINNIYIGANNIFTVNSNTAIGTTSGTVTIAGNTEINGDLIINGDLTVNGTAKFNSQTIR